MAAGLSNGGIYWREVQVKSFEALILCCTRELGWCRSNKKMLNRLSPRVAPIKLFNEKKSKALHRKQKQADGSRAKGRLVAKLFYDANYF